jgi:hypothetical protein
LHREQLARAGLPVEEYHPRQEGEQMAEIRNVVLVHGGFVDGSGWEGVYKILKKDGYTVSVVQNPTISLADDVAVTKRVLAASRHGRRSRAGT